MKRTLYFEGAGCVPCGEVENCHIRTAYRNKNGEIVYLEMLGFEKPYKRVFDKNGNKVHPVAGFVDCAYKVKQYRTEEGKTAWNDCNKNRYEAERKSEFEYTKAGILHMVNTYLDGDFDEIVILPFLSGYYVHRENAYDGNCPYNLMDDFHYDEARTKQAEKIKQYFYDFEKNVLGKRYPNNSVYFERDILKVIIPYSGFNDCVKIDNVFDFKFDYKQPAGTTVVKW